MNRQYRASRGRPGPGGLVGTIEVGEIIYIEDRPHRYFGRANRRNPWIVEAWHNREYAAHHQDSAGRWQSVMMAGGHLATVRSLRTGERRKVADWLLQASAA